MVVTAVQTESAAPGRIDLFAKAGTPPGFKAGQFDLRPDWNSAADDRALQISIDRSLKQFRPGTWFVGVVGSDGGATFDVGIATFDCPFNCSSNGACNSGTHECACADGFGGTACDLILKDMAYDAAVAGSVASEYAYFTLPPVTDEMLAGNVEVVIQASMEGAIAQHHLEARPAVLVAYVSDGELCMCHKIPLSCVACPCPMTGPDHILLHTAG